jgi:hypothetical protein
MARLYKQKIALTYTFLEWVRALPGMEDPSMQDEKGTSARNENIADREG